MLQVKNTIETYFPAPLTQSWRRHKVARRKVYSMAKWTLDDIAWHQFDPRKIDADLVSLIKAASMVEYNAYDYEKYLCQIFSDDPVFQQVVHEWAEEEVQHGLALRRWAELADPDFDFDKSFQTFIAGYQIPLDSTESVRGSRSGELIARCVVETGTSSYYTAIKEYTREPVLQAICAKIAADEFRHYKLFYTHLQRYLEKENIGTFGRLKIALSRITESEDDELAYAFFAAHEREQLPVYDHETCKNLYLKRAYQVYRKPHVERMIGMVLKAVKLETNGFLHRVFTQVAWSIMKFKIWLLRNAEPAYFTPAHNAHLVTSH